MASVYLDLSCSFHLSAPPYKSSVNYTGNSLCAIVEAFVSYPVYVFVCEHNDHDVHTIQLTSVGLAQVCSNKD